MSYADLCFVFLSACGGGRCEQLRFGENKEQSEECSCPDTTLFVEKKLLRQKEKTFFVLADLRNEKQIESCFLLCFAGEEQSYIWY